MPYERKGKCVYKKGASKPVGCSKTVEKAKAYLKRLYSVEEIVKDELMKVLGEINEPATDI